MLAYDASAKRMCPTLAACEHVCIISHCRRAGRCNECGHMKQELPVWNSFSPRSPPTPQRIQLPRAHATSHSASRLCHRRDCATEAGSSNSGSADDSKLPDTAYPVYLHHQCLSSTILRLPLRSKLIYYLARRPHQLGKRWIACCARRCGDSPTATDMHGVTIAKLASAPPNARTMRRSSSRGFGPYLAAWAWLMCCCVGTGLINGAVAAPSQELGPWCDYGTHGSTQACTNGTACMVRKLQANGTAISRVARHCVWGGG